MPTVSVIVPNYNHARFLPKRIESILNQTFQDFEVILLDDCSTDDSRSILSRYSNDPRVTIEFNKVNSGSTFKQWNKGVRLARGKYVWIAESDDYADEHLLEELVSRLDEDPSSVLCYCRSWRVSADDKLDGHLDSYLTSLDPHKWTADFRAEGHEECRRYLVRCNTVLSASSVVFCKEAYEQAGGADESLSLCGDWKTWASMALLGGTISYVGETLNYYRFHEASVTEKSQQNGVWPAEALQVAGWILKKATLDDTERTALHEGLSEIWIPAVLNKRIPIRVRWSILKNARALDNHALRRLSLPALTALRLTIARRYRSRQGWLQASSGSGIERSDRAGH